MRTQQHPRGTHYEDHAVSSVNTTDTPAAPDVGGGSQVTVPGFELDGHQVLTT